MGCYSRVLVPIVFRPSHLRGGLFGLLAFFVVASSSSSSHSRYVLAPHVVPTVQAAVPPRAPTAAQPRAFLGAQLDGQLFPERVLALTWDDGPDKHTLELARFLESRRVSGTFFVVQSWDPALSDTPGSGPGVYETGYSRLPILGQLTRLHQRVGNHTLNHARLSAAPPEVFVKELAENQRQIDPFLQSEVRLFRAPAGAWTGASEALLSSDPYLAHLIGPFRWDIDRKDWENSVECDTEPSECERWRGGLRLKPSVTAGRYLSSIERGGRGIVLLHDRVGEVGSDYALRLARTLIPELIDRGYVFAAPLLRFSPLAPRVSAALSAQLGQLAPSRLELVDVNRDGRMDLCAAGSTRTLCLRSKALPGDGEGNLPRAYFADPQSATWSAGAGVSFVASGGVGQGLLSADLDGDGRGEFCSLEPAGVVCSRNARLAPARVWLPRAELGSASLPLPNSAALADVNGDGRADLCWTASEGVHCALSKGGSFAPSSLWSRLALPTLLLGDLNGDGRSDLCAPIDGGVSCAFSTGSSFTSATRWLELSGPLRAASLALADINGDGRADLCSYVAGQVACGMAP